jgi:hypothetical protein
LRWRVIIKSTNNLVALFEENIAQAKSNLNFLETVNQKIGNYYDWQVTICFYTAGHLVNAHLTTNNLPISSA